MRGIVPGKKTFDLWETVSAETKQSLRGYLGDVWVTSKAPLVQTEDQPADVVEQLARRRGGKLSFLVVGRMSAEFARALATHVGPIRVETTKPQGDPPTAGAVAALCAHHGSLDLPGQWIRPDTIERVLAHEGGLTVRIPSSPPEWIPLVPESEAGDSGIEE
jgi:hypothetical protein